MKNAHFRARPGAGGRGSEWSPGTLWTRPPSTSNNYNNTINSKTFECPLCLNTYLSALHVVLGWAPEVPLRGRFTFVLGSKSRESLQRSEEMGLSRERGRRERRIKLECMSLCTPTVCCYLRSATGGCDS